MSFPRRGSIPRAGLTALLLGMLLSLSGAPQASAAPGSDDTDGLVTADPLPTVQVDGVVWDQEVVDDRVYVTGKFTSARPAGAQPGTQQTERKNLLAYDLHTGELIDQWAPELNASGLAIAASGDGATIYVAGNFTYAEGRVRDRVAAFDAQTGLLLDWRPTVNTTVSALAVSDDTVYLGGDFTIVNGSSRTRLAAVDAELGALLPWAPTADRRVDTVAVHGASDRVIVGGRFGWVNDMRQPGVAAVHATTGALFPWELAGLLRSGDSAGSSIADITIDGDAFYGVGWSHSGGGGTGYLEGVFAADVTTGELRWLQGCRGDNYGVAVSGGAVYAVGHEHECGMVGYHREEPQRTTQLATALRKAGSTSGRINAFGPFSGWQHFAGRPATDPLPWLPSFMTGAATGKNQAGWTVEVSDGYVLIGGEFPSVNEIPQQGLVRFVVDDRAPNREGPVGMRDSVPAADESAAGAVRVTWTAAWDRDGSSLRYDLLRGPVAESATVVASRTLPSSRFSRSPLSFFDRAAPAGATTYRVRVTDEDGNTDVSLPVTIQTSGERGTVGAYHARVAAMGAIHHWPMGDRSGSAAMDVVSGDDLALLAPADLNVEGALAGNTDTAIGWSAGNNNDARAAAGSWHRAPQQFSIEAWFRTTSTSGGQLVGFGNARTGRSSTQTSDRHVYMTTNGRLLFGVRPDYGARRTVQSGPGFNDGQWHHVVATLGPDGAALYLDGEPVADDGSIAAAQEYWGYWRIAGDRLSSWPSAPSNEGFIGSLDEVAIYAAALDLGEVRGNFTASGRTGDWEPEPDPDPKEVIRDDFDRSVVDGWGVADVGGPWTVNERDDFAVDEGVGRLTVPSPGVRRAGFVPVVPRADVEVLTDLAVGREITGTGVYATTVVRRVAPGSQYEATLWFRPGGEVIARLVRRMNGQVTLLASEVVPGLSYAPGQRLEVRLSAIGTQLRLKVWQAGTEEPASWLVAAADTTPELQVPGEIGMDVYVSGSADPDPVVVTIDRWVAGAPPLASPAPVDPMLVEDRFDRSASSGWGGADIGGAWSTNAPSDFSVDERVGRVVVRDAAHTRSGFLPATPTGDLDVRTDFAVAQEITGGGVFLSTVVRRVAPGSHYEATVWIRAGGEVELRLVRRVGGLSEVLASAPVAGLSYSPTERLEVRLSAIGTQLRAKVWVWGRPEPATWIVMATDATPTLQQPGEIGTSVYVSGSATLLPVEVSTRRWAVRSSS